MACVIPSHSDPLVAFAKTEKSVTKAQDQHQVRVVMLVLPNAIHYKIQIKGPDYRRVLVRLRHGRQVCTVRDATRETFAGARGSIFPSFATGNLG